MYVLYIIWIIELFYEIIYPWLSLQFRPSFRLSGLTAFDDNSVFGTVVADLLVVSKSYSIMNLGINFFLINNNNLLWLDRGASLIQDRRLQYRFDQVLQKSAQYPQGALFTGFFQNFIKLSSYHSFARLVVYVRAFLVPQLSWRQVGVPKKRVYVLLRSLI